MLLLCSNSKTRAELLKKAQIPFIQEACEFDEDSIPTQNPYEFVVEATKGKFEANLKCFGDETPIICADTIITDRKILIRKPKNIEEAKKLLLIQSDNNIEIVTYQIIGFQGNIYKNLSKTIYKFKKFDEKDLEIYLNSGAWQGSAGGCKVEGFCKKYIENMQGYESTAMGLTVEWVKEIYDIISE